MSKQDVIIVGGGLAGLAVAAYLARAKKRVTVYERAQELGGRARTRHEQGFALNLGGHAFYAGGEGMRVLRDLGITPRGRTPATDGSLAITSGRIARLPTSMMSLFATDLFGWGAKVDAGKLLSSLQRIDTRALSGESVAAWLDQKTTKPEVRAYVEAAVRVATYTNAPSLMNAGAAVAQIKLATKPGVLYLDDGWGALVADLADVAKSAGARIVSSSPVRAIAHDGRAQGVVLASGEHVFAEEVVVAGSPTMLRVLLGGSRDETAREYDAALVPLHAACLDVALSRLPFASNKFALGIDSPLYFSVHSATARVAPEGGALIHTMKYLDPTLPNDPARDEAELTALLDLVQPGWRDHVVHRNWLPSMITSNALVRPNMVRPSTRYPEVDGVHVVGDWIGSDGMLADASLASAREAARAIIRGAGVTHDSIRHASIAHGVA